MSRFLWTACILAIKKHQILLTAIPLTGIEWQILMQTVGEAFCFNHRQVILPKKRKFCQYKPVELRKIPCFFWYSIYIFSEYRTKPHYRFYALTLFCFVLFTVFVGNSETFLQKNLRFISYTHTQRNKLPQGTPQKKKESNRKGVAVCLVGCMIWFGKVFLYFLV